jgi:hypothetical protein
MRELQARQIQGEPPRRRFSDDYFDLYIFGEGGEIEGFQLCYDCLGDERAFTWMPGSGTQHQRVEDPELEAGRLAIAPILAPGTTFPIHHVLERFRTVSDDLPEVVRDLVLRVLEEHLD